MDALERVNQFVAPIVAPVIGQTAWGATLGVGSFLTAEFGKAVPAQKPRGREHGEWHLWITYAAWRIEQAGNTLAASEDERSRLTTAVEHLNGLAIRSIEVVSPALDTLFTFDQDIVIRVFPVYSEQYEHWQLFVPNGNVLTIGPGAGRSYQSASLP